jgi:sugar phosphate isomerase/epimerase
MLVGAMNNPARPLEDELHRIAAAGFAVADVTLEPPAAWPCDGAALAALLRELGLIGVGHTAYYLPIASPFPRLRRAAHEAMHEAFDVFAEAGIDRVNVHPDPLNRLFASAEVQARNAEAVAELAAAAATRGLMLMLENLGRVFGTAEELRPLFEAASGLGFHLDVGHANLGRGAAQPNRTAELLAGFGDRLAHVHISDNLGLDDLHLPLGAGAIEWPTIVRHLKNVGWDGPVTLEIFSATPRHLESSRELWLGWWSNEGPEKEQAGAA